MRNIAPLIEECCLCLESHKVKDCCIIKSPSIIKDTATMCKAYATLPSVLSIEKMLDGKEIVKTKSFLSKGTRFGPVDSKTIEHVPCDNEFPLKVIMDSNQFEYLDTDDRTICNWMCLVRPADCFQDCNLVAYQSEFCIYFSALKDIDMHSELKVYYAPFYAEKMGVKFTKSIESSSIRDYDDMMFDDLGSESLGPNDPLGPDDMMEEIHEMPATPSHMDKSTKNTTIIDVSKLSAKSLGVQKSKKEWICSTCEAVFPTIPDFAKHLHGHYASLGNKLKDKNLSTPSANENVVSNSDMLLSLSGVYNVPNLVSSTSMPTSLNLGDELQVMSDLNLSYINLIPSGSMLYLDSTPRTIADANSKPKPPVKKMIVCEICGKKFDKASNILRHLKKHSGEFHCGRCSRVFARKETLQVHECVNLIYNCDLCDQTFTHVSLFRQHKTEHLRRTGKYTLDSLSCYQCSHQSDTITNFIEHIRSHNTNAVSLDSVKCPICGQTYARPRVFFNTHLRCHEGNVYCHQCKGVFLGRKTYEKHVCFNKRSPVPRTPVKPKARMYRRAASFPEPQISSRFICDICLDHFTDEAELELHKGQHEKDSVMKSRPVLCDHCGKSYDSASSLRKHFYKIHANNKITCKEPSCQKQFDSQDQLLLHIETHQDTRVSNALPGSYPCTYCSKVFTMKRYRTRHILIRHGADFRYECHVCDKKFKDKTYLNSHVKKMHCATPTVRRQNYRYSCHLCKRSFVKKPALRKHIESHSVVVSYSCVFCSKVTVRAKRMLHHLSNVHPDKKPEWNTEQFFNQLKVVKDLSDTRPVHSANETYKDVQSQNYAEQNVNHHGLEYQNQQIQEYQGYSDQHAMDHDNLLTDDPMKLFDLNTESNSNAATLKGRELPVDSITNFDLSVFYNESEELPCATTMSSVCPPSQPVSSLCPPVVKAPVVNQLCLPDGITLPLQTVQTTSDTLISAPVYSTLSVSETGEFLNGESLLYVVLDPASSLRCSTGNNIQVTPSSSTIATRMFKDVT